MVAGLATASAWLRGGTHPAWSAPLFFLALLSLLLLVLLPHLRAWPRKSNLPGVHFIRWRDPVFVGGAIFMLLLLTQWLNAGRILYFDSEIRAWSYSPPRLRHLPGAITPAEARQMLDWFLPAWVVLLGLRSRLMNSRAIRLSLRLIVYQAGLLGLFGLIQYATGTTHMYGFVPMRPHFYATFGYPNHAGSYFLMIMCLAAALVSWDLGSDQPPRIWIRRIALSSVFFLSFVSANLSLSRSAIILSWIMLVILAYSLLKYIWPRFTAVQRLNTAMVGVAVLSLAILLTVGLAHSAIRKEFSPEPGSATPMMEKEVSFRWFQMHSALRMWADHPWFGVGGWGYRYLIGHYVPADEWRRINEGKANVHNDPLQFLAEFGLVGAGAMAVVVGSLLLSVWRAKTGFPPLVLLPLLGVGMVGLQSMIDLPFRSPAVLIVWLVCLGSAARVLPARRETKATRSLPLIS